jgi:hypothetical protein
MTPGMTPGHRHGTGLHPGGTRGTVPGTSLPPLIGGGKTPERP